MYEQIHRHKHRAIAKTSITFSVVLKRALHRAELVDKLSGNFDAQIVRVRVFDGV